ncbi:MAG TPA: chemotaxis protein CheW [Sulfuricaulis sp.]|jgi:purine-binding chemotaxis protein CheW|nr:chemotaxis protein CheW [Sulfuricaulis sp.]
MKTAHATIEKIKPSITEEQFLTFKLCGQEYGISALKVQEIKGWEKVTPIPNSPTYIRGVLNLRGLIVPVIDLRMRFNIEELAYTAVTAIVVVNISERLAGLVVDSVSDVIEVSEEQRCIAPDFEGQKDREFINGLAQIDGKLLILLDVDRLINPELLDKKDAKEVDVSTS